MSKISKPGTSSPLLKMSLLKTSRSTHQACEQVSYADLPDEAKADVAEVFDVTGRLPLSWVDKVNISSKCGKFSLINPQDSADYQPLARFATPEILTFIQEAYDQCPGLFCDKVHNRDIPKLYVEISTVYTAWRRLKWMRKSKEKWSEHDFAANV